MNSGVLFAVGFVVAAVALFAFAYFNTYRGYYHSLQNAKVGEVYNFEYEQPYHGEPERILARVIEPVYTLDDAQISKLNARSSYRRNDPSFQRTKHLVTCEMLNGEIRNFYAERTKNCRRSLFAPIVFKAGFAHIL